MRKEVKAFALEMERRMAKYDGDKGSEGWKALNSPVTVLERLKDKRSTFLSIMDTLWLLEEHGAKLEAVKELRAVLTDLAADMGNYAMMAADLSRALPEMPLDWEAPAADVAEYAEKYPECMKLAAFGAQRRAIVEFLDWLRNEKHCVRAEYIGADLVRSTGSDDTLVLEYLEIDVVKLETERRAMIDEIRKKDRTP